MRKSVFLILVMMMTLGIAPYAIAQESIEDRLQKLEDRVAEANNIEFSGAIEVEAKSTTNSSGEEGKEDEKQSTIDLSSFEFGVDAKISDNVSGSVVLKHADDDFGVDEGFINIKVSKTLPISLTAGKFCIPFGNFDSNFVSDPTTLTLGESNIAALMAKYQGKDEKYDLSLGLFNGAAQEKDDDDQIDSYFASFAFNPFEGLSFGASYISNVAGASNALNEEVQNDKILDSIVAGYSAFFSYEINRFKLIGEYLAVSDAFKAGEIYEGDSKEREPSTWSAQASFAPLENLDFALRCAGADDGAEFIPETEYGFVLNWGFFKDTSLAVEFLHQDFEDDIKEVDTITTQLAISF